MNKFEILNKEAKALTMAELDKEAAEFWGKEIDRNTMQILFPTRWQAKTLHFPRKYA